jgi:hypothetical protein
MLIYFEYSRICLLFGQLEKKIGHEEDDEPLFDLFLLTFATMSKSLASKTKSYEEKVSVFLFIVTSRHNALSPAPGLCFNSSIRYTEGPK